ncbi:MAG: hypothetical protein QM831_26030 [Kofleriaceae bacterium]
MNDLAILYPLPKTQTEVDAMLKADALVGESTFQGDTIGISYDNLRATAVRIDPCFGSACEPQLRIVMQPVAMGNAQDAAVHLTYGLSRDQLASLLNDIVTARGDTGDLGPLAPHPSLVAQGLSGAFATSLKQILPKYAGNLERMTQFSLELTGGLGNNDEAWELDSYTVAGGVATEHVIPALESEGVTRMTISAATDPLVSNGSPASTSADAFDKLANSTGATHDQIQAAFTAALHVENPKLENADTIDCASCHLAGPAIELVGMPMGLTGDAFVPSSSIPPADLVRTTPLQDSGVLNIHAFSYRQNEPMINQRVLNDTAASLAYLTE